MTAGPALAVALGGLLAVTTYLRLLRRGRGVDAARAATDPAVDAARGSSAEAGGVPQRGAVGSFAEIRIHGVSGTPPNAMLFRDAAGEVLRTRSYTDSLTGFFTDPKQDPDAPVQVEAYSWGGLTSSAGQILERVKRIGWLLLIPFAMVNVAYWARPDIDKVTAARGSANRYVTGIAIRWAALLLTTVAISAACLVSMDLLAWQCFRGGSRVCSLPGWFPASVLDPLGRAQSNAPAQRLATAAILPISAVATLFLLSLQSRRRYEAVASRDRAVGGDNDTDDWGPTGAQDGDILLRRGRMWAGVHRIGRQQLNHLAAALAMIVAYLCLPILPRAGGTLNGWVLQAAAVAALLALICAFASAACSVRDGNEFCGLSQGWPDLAARWLARFGAGIAATSLIAAMYVSRFRLPDAGINEGRDLLAGTLWAGMDGSLLLSLPLVLLAALVLFLMFASRSWVEAVVVAVVLLGIVTAGYANATTGADRSLTAWLVVGVALAATGAAVGRRHRRVGADTGQVGRAWRGAAPAVVLGAGVWVGFLFTIALLVGTAGVLNGEQPVSAIAAAYPSPSSPTAAILADGQRTIPTQLRATGEITVRDAVVLSEADGALVVTQGTVGVQELWTDAGGVSRQLPGLVAEGGSLSTDNQISEVAATNTCLTKQSAVASRLPRAQECVADESTGTSYVSRGSLALDPEQQRPLAVNAGVQIVVADPPQETLVLPTAALWAVTLLPIWTVAVVIGLAVAYWRFGVNANNTIDAQTQRDADVLGGMEDDDIPRCEAARRRAAFVHRAERLAGLVSAITAAVFLVLIAGPATGSLPWDIWEPLRYVGDLGLYLSLGLSLALVWFISQVRKSDSARRQAGILWDIATFLPRVAHPLGPPSYGERVVPEMTRRVRTLLDESPGRVVILSGHSQGSVITVAVAARLDDEQLSRLRVVTYGSQLRAWFGRVFPAVLGPEQLGTGLLAHSLRLDTAEPDAYEVPQPPPTRQAPPPATLAGKLGPGHWVNLFRRTDPIGFRIFSDHDSVPSPAEPPERPRDVYVLELDDRYDLSTHSNYQFTSAYAQVITAWVGTGGQ